MKSTYDDNPTNLLSDKTHEMKQLHVKYSSQTNMIYPACRHQKKTLLTPLFICYIYDAQPAPPIMEEYGGLRTMTGYHDWT